MKKIMMSACVAVLLAFVSCREAEKLMYDDFAGIHFLFPVAGDDYIIRKDTLVYSFAFVNAEVKEHVIYIPVQIEGFRKNFDRTVNVRLIEKTTTAKAGTDYEQLKSSYTVKADAGTDSIPITVKRTADIRTGAKTISLELTESQDFKLGIKNKTNIHVSFSDMLEKPVWWDGWSYLFGAYNRIKYQEWIRLRGDRGELPVVNIRPYMFRQLYPREVAQIMELRVYFENNPRYTNEEAGDPDNLGDRIVVPVPI